MDGGYRSAAVRMQRVFEQADGPGAAADATLELVS